MADILKVYTAEQLYDMYRDEILADNVGLTDFNSGSIIRSVLESNSEIISSIMMDFKEAIYKAIPIALYQGFGFDKLGEVNATGFIRPYRRPAFWINYTGAGTAALITSNLTSISASVTGAAPDNFSFDYTTYPTINDLVTAIDNESNWSATLVQTGTTPSTSLFQYSGKDAVGSTNYLNTTGLDIMFSTAVEIIVSQGFAVSINQLSILTTANGTISAGESGVAIAAEVQTPGTTGNIAVNAVDTLNGKGYINSSIEGIEQVINDSAFSGGSAEESDDSRKTRFSETVNSLNAGTEDGIISAIKGITGVRSVGIRESFPFKGTNTIVVDDGTGAISASLLASVEKVLYGDPSDLGNYPGKNAAGIAYEIVAPTIVPVNVTITVLRLSTVNVNLDDIEIDVQTAVEQYINTRPLGADVILTEIIRVGKNSNSAVYDMTITIPVSNVSIGANEFAKTGSGTGATVSVSASITTVV